MALWTPASITTAAWFDASDASTITESSGAVSQWDDKSGNAEHLVQATASKKPTTSSRTLNSLNVLDLDGNDEMLASAFVLTNSHSIFAVASTDSNGYRRILNSNTDKYYYFGVDASNQNYATFYGNGGSWFDTNENSPSSSVASAQVMGVTSDGSNATPYFNGVVMSTKSSNMGGSAPAGLLVGNFTGGTQGWDGAIAEIVIINSVVQTADRQRIEGYLAHKWGLESLLASGHPYKSAAPTQIGITSVTPSTGPGATSTSITLAGTDFLSKGPKPHAYWRLNDASSGAATTAAASTGGQALAIANSTWGTSTVGTSRNVLNVSTTSTAGTSSLSVGSSSTFSVSAWVYPTSNSVNEDTIWILTNSHSGVGTWVSLTTGTTTPRYSDGSAWHSASSSLTLNSWNHLVVVVDGTAVNFYINGTAAGSATVNSRTWSGVHFYAGYIPSFGAGGHFQGKFAEFAAWSGIALSADEVTGLYGSGTPPDVTTGIPNVPGLTTTINIGLEPCTNVSVASDISMTCDTPLSFTAGAEDVVATNSTGTATLAGGFTYTTPLLDRQQIGSVFQDWRRPDSVDSIGSVFTDVRDAESVDSIGAVFTDHRRAESVDSIGSVMAVPELPATTTSVPTPSLYNKLDAISGTTVTSAVGNDGTSTGLVFATAQHPSGSGNSLRFSSSRLLFDTTALDGTATWTISWWERPESLSRYAYRVDWRAGSYGYRLIYTGSSYTSLQYYGNSVHNLGITFSTLAWRHYALTCNSGSFVVYQDGAANGTTFTDGRYTLSTDLTLANAEGSTIYGITGNMSEFVLWNSVLSAAEIAAVYNSGSPPDLTSGITGGTNPTKHYTEKLFTPGSKHVWFM